MEGINLFSVADAIRNRPEAFKSLFTRTIQICRKCQLFSFCTPTRVLPQRQLKGTCGRGYDGLLSRFRVQPRR